MARDSSGSVDQYSEVLVGQQVDTAAGKDSGTGAEKIPPHKSGHLLDYALVNDQFPSALRKMSPTIQSVGDTHYRGHRQHQDGICLELVERGLHQQDSHRKF